MATFDVPVENVEALVARITELSKRATKLSLPGPVLTLGETREVVIGRKYDVLGEEYEVRRTFTAVEISGESPKIAGWSFAATLDHGEGGNVIRSLVPSLPERYRTAPPLCEHCNTIRRRTETFVLAHEDGTLRQVGRQCLADFLGHPSPEALAEQATLIASALALGEESGSDGFGGGGTPTFDLAGYLPFVAQSIRVDGWCSRKNAKELFRRATADLALDNYNPPRFLPASQRPEEPLARDVTRAAEAVEWAKALEPTNDYQHNLKVLATRGYSDLSQLGYAASIVPAYGRYLGDLAEAQKRAAKKPSEYFGTVGERETFAFVCTKILSFEGNFGTTFLAFLVDKDGNEAKWFASAYPSFQEGEAVVVAATVKNHEEYKGTRQTQLSRVSEVTHEYLLAEHEKALAKAARLAKKAAREAAKAAKTSSAPVASV